MTQEEHQRLEDVLSSLQVECSDCREQSDGSERSFFRISNADPDQIRSLILGEMGHHQMDAGKLDFYVTILSCGDDVIIRCQD